MSSSSTIPSTIPIGVVVAAFLIDVVVAAVIDVAAAEIGEAFEETARRSAEERIAADPSFVPSSHLTENTLERAMGLRV